MQEMSNISSVDLHRLLQAVFAHLTPSEGSGGFTLPKLIVIFPQSFASVPKIQRMMGKYD